ncbi:LysM peptidoglycan-binding domain-containing M23 family metallopeptidase [Streptomyces sp. NPDC051098]|uniref:M23 family metallopeptidase n=1 Tax=Streptomyces sp. NPDC051098 TaxID=3155411 RepID=UPI00343B2A45
MPGKGKHRRPKSRSISRGFVAAGTGGAAIALPLMGAAGAHAADKAAPAAAPAVAPQKAAAAPAASTAQKQAAPTSYRVVAGDYLSKIAAEHDVRGGWQKLYADNRAAVGDDPALIHPGLKLTLGAKAEERPAEKPAQKAAPAKPKASDTEDRASRGESRASETAAKASTSDSAESAPQENASGYSAPLDSAAVTTPYRASGAMWSSGYHTGIDFAASTGTTVKSVGPGSVVSAGWSGAYGNEVVIQHTDGTYSQYAHLSSLTVSAGQNVSGGQQIGLSGSTGNSSGPHLHFEIRTGPSYGSDMDPVSYLRQHGVSL